MPDDYSPVVIDMDLQSYIDEIASFFFQLGVSREQAADCVLEMLWDAYETYGTRH